MKNDYNEPKIKIIFLKNEDVLTASPADTENQLPLD